MAAKQAHWGLGARLLGDIFLGSVDAEEHERFGRLQREAATAETAAVVLALVYRLDMRDQLAHVRSPTSVAHRRDDRAVRIASGVRSRRRFQAPPSSR